MSETWTHRYISTRAYSHNDYGPGRVIKVTAGLSHLKGNARPHFSVTADIYRPGARDIDAGGCMHAEVARYWPQLQPVIALHLSDDAGVPMHAEANGWYHLAGYYGGAGERYHGGNGERQHWNPDGSFNGYRFSTPLECLQTFADHVRIDIEAAKLLAERFKQDASIAPAGESPQAPYWRRVRDAFAFWLESQRPRFKAEADAAVALLDSLVAAQAARKDAHS